MKTVKQQRRERFEEVLSHAERIAPNSEFVQSCREFFKEKDYLTIRQVEALEDIEPPDHSRIEYCPNGLFDDDYPEWDPFD